MKVATLFIFYVIFAIFQAVNSENTAIEISREATSKILGVYKTRPAMLKQIIDSGKVFELFSITEAEQTPTTTCGFLPSQGVIRVCPNGFFCQVDNTTCGGQQWVNNGTCLRLPTSCSNFTCNNATLTRENGAVCGCDGRVYCNACVMNQNRVSLSIWSRCETIIVDGEGSMVRPSIFLTFIVLFFFLFFLAK